MKTSFISAYNLEALAQTNGTHEITVNTSKEFYALHDYLVFTLGWDCYEYAHVSQDGSVTINIRVSNNQSESTNPDNTPSTMNANETTANDIRELISRLRYEFQQYHDNASKGGSERRRNMVLLRWDIRKLERRLKAIEAETRTKSINGIMNQANRLMSVCNAVQNFKRADVIRAIAFRYYDNIRACVGRFNYNDDSEYNKEYSRAQYMNA